MRESNFEVLVLRTVDNGQFDEDVVDDISYTVAEPGCEYYVKVIAHRNEDGSWPFPYIRIGLYIDGFDVQYWKRLDFMDPSVTTIDHMSATFWGFKKNNSDLRSFVFATPSVLDEGKGGHSAAGTKPLGELKVVIHEASVSDGVYGNQSGQYLVPTAPEGIHEGKKFWQQASLTTTAGRRVTEKEKFAPLQRWSNVSTVPSHLLLLRYHTRSMLDFMRTFLPHQKQQQQHQQSLKRASSSTSSESGLGDELSIMENPPKASRPSSGIIDLTAESDEEAEEQNGAGDEDDEVVEVRGTPREVPFLDISQDD